MLNEYKDILTVEELCKVLKIGKNTAYHLLQIGEIHSIKIGRVYKIPKKSLITYLNK